MATSTTTEPETAADPAAPMVPPATPRGVPYRLHAEDYFRMVDAEIIPHDRRVELWDGALVETMAKKQPHAVAQNVLVEALVAALLRQVPGEFHLTPENPIQLDRDTVPLPDLAIVRGRPRDYPLRPPTAADVALVIEIADSSLRKDTGRLLAAYAAAAIPVYWVVNIPGRRVEVYAQPAVREGVGVYQALLACGPADEVPLTLDGREIARIPARDILPAEPA